MSMFAMGMGVIFLVDCVHINIYKYIYIYIYNVFLVFLCRVYFIHIYGWSGLMRKKTTRHAAIANDEKNKKMHKSRTNVRTKSTKNT